MSDNIVPIDRGRRLAADAEQERQRLACVRVEATVLRQYDNLERIIRVVRRYPHNRTLEEMHKMLDVCWDTVLEAEEKAAEAKSR